MKAHTPGPWKVLNKRVFLDDTDNGFAVDIDTEANARLIATAPELLWTLEGCELLFRKWSGAECKDTEGGYDPNLYACWTQIQTIIRKAKGES